MSLKRLPNILRVSISGMLACLHTLAMHASPGATGTKPPTVRPNIIFLLTDDQRWDSLGCTGNTIIQTPNIDSLARQGALFRNGFVTTAICCVSRASIFTGQYERRHKIGDFVTPFTSAA